MRKFEETVELMLSNDYKERFIAEYWQTKIRYERLKALNAKIKAQRYVDPVKRIELPFETPEELFREQQRLMGEYLNVLELRAAIEGVDLYNTESTNIE